MFENKFANVMVLLDKLANYAVEEFFTSKQMDIGKVGILIHRKRGALGYCYLKDNWNMDNNEIREIALTPSCLSLGKEQILNTLLHECVHAYNYQNGIKDGTGKNHNKKFKETCDMIGLGCEKREKYGFGTSLEFNSDECNQRFESIFNKFTKEEIETLDKLSEIIPEKEEKEKDRNLCVFICPVCGAKARAKKEAHLMCGDCMQDMEGNVDD